MTMIDSLKERLMETGWAERALGDGKLWFRDEEDYTEGELRLVVQWLMDQRSSWDQDGRRGCSNRFASSPFDSETWFVKQYHHGGLFAGQGDDTYERPDRFLKELLAAIRAGERVNVPDPRFVYYEPRGEEYIGFYVSKQMPGESFTRTLRMTGDSEFAREAGEILAKLHETGIDHQDYHVGNLLVDGDRTVVVTDFDPVGLETIGRFTRERRVQRFIRSLEKHGFTGSDVRVFREGYNSWANSGNTFLFQSILDFSYDVKHRVSDALYTFQDRPLEDIHLEKILVRAPNWLGDAVMSLPFIERLSNRESDPIIDVTARESVAPIYENHGPVGKVWTLPKEKTLEYPNVSEERYSLLITIPKSLRTGIQAYLSGVPRRVGFATQGRSMFLTDRVELGDRDRSVHHAKLYFKLLENILDPPEQPRIDELEVPGTDSSFEFDWSDSYVTFHPGSAYGPAKRWPPEHFNRFLRQLLEKTDYRLVALGVESERPIAREVLEGIDDARVENFVGRTNLEEAMQLLSGSSGTIANDSGIMHLSAALGTPTVGIFGSSDPELTHPIGGRTRVLYEGVDCSPCFERTCPLNEDKYKCLTRIQPDSVFNQFQELLGETNERTTV